MIAKGLIDRMTEHVKGNRELALNILRDRGHVHSDSEGLTEEGKYREALGTEGRFSERKERGGK